MIAFLSMSNFATVHRSSSPAFGGLNLYSLPVAMSFLSASVSTNCLEEDHATRRDNTARLGSARLGSARLGSARLKRDNVEMMMMTRTMRMMWTRARICPH